MPALSDRPAKDWEAISTPLAGEVMRPSALGSAEIAVWHQMMAGTPSLHRAFFTPAFAQACERATARAYVAILHDRSRICGFLPFQFASAWHERIGLAERMGGALSQGAGLIGWPGLRIDAQMLLRLSGLAAFHVTQLMGDQDRFGLDAVWSHVGFVTDLKSGPEAYFTDLFYRDRGLVRDTERCLRKAQKTYGTLDFVRPEQITTDMLRQLIAEKRLQYQRTNVADPFENSEHLRLVEILNEAPSPDCRPVLTRLEVGGHALAQHLGLQYHDVLSYWFPVYDHATRSVSPGRLLLWQIIRRASQDGIALIDYGEGDAPYKRELSTGSLRYGRAYWSRGGVRSLVARVWQSAEWRLQRRPPNPHHVPAT
jgi:CelD/BcsL family acetyltransferase involved in cellulose biosynthesis